MKKIWTALCITILFAALVLAVPAEADEESPQVTFKELADDRCQVNWTIPKSSGESYVRIYLTVSDHDPEAEAIELAGIQSGTSGNLTVDLPDADPGYYHFMISITTMSGTLSTAFSDEAFFYDNRLAAGELSGVLTGRSRDRAYALWEEDASGTLYIYDAETKELLLKSENVMKPAFAEIPEGHEDVIIGAAAYSQSGSGRFAPVPSLRKDMPDLSGVLPDSEITSQKEWNLSPGEYEMRLFCNGEECRLRNEQFRADLKEGENTLLVFATDADGNTGVSEKILTLDTQAPLLTIEYPSSGMSTSEKTVFIQGCTEEGASMTCDDFPAEMTGDCFSIPKELSYGGNTIRVQAEDAAGNITAVNVEISRSFWSGQNRLLIPAGIVGVIGLIAELYMLVIRQKRKKL